MEERRRSPDPHIAELHARVGRLEEKTDAQTNSIKKIECNTGEIVEAWRALSGGLKVLGWLGAGAKWLTYFTAFIGSVAGLWYSLKHGITK